MGVVEDKLFCAAPWNHMFVRSDGEIEVCCMMGGRGPSLGNINDNTWEEIWKGEKYQELREKFLKRDPETLKYCKHCVEYDRFGVGSCRHQFNGFVHDSEGAVRSLLRNPKIVSLDLRTSRVCGLACLICGPWNSTKWEKEVGYNPVRVIGETGYDNLADLVEQLKGRIIHVNLVGGEPFMMKEVYSLIQTLQPFKHRINVLLNTNCQTLKFKGQEVLPLLKGFKYVQIDASLDAIGKAAEYQRYGATWETVKTNFEELLKTDYRIWVHPTISIFNILRIPELLNYLHSLNFDRENLCGGNMLSDPDYYSIANLPDKVKEMVQVELENRYVPEEYRKYIKDCIDYMNSKKATVPWKKIVSEITSHDKRRNNSFLEVNPEFTEFWHED